MRLGFIGTGTIASAIIEGTDWATSLVGIPVGHSEAPLPPQTYRRTRSGSDLQLVYTSHPLLPPAVAAFAKFLMQRLGDAMPGAVPANASRP